MTDERDGPQPPGRAASPTPAGRRRSPDDNVEALSERVVALEVEVRHLESFIAQLRSDTVASEARMYEHIRSIDHALRQIERCQRRVQWMFAGGVAVVVAMGSITAWILKVLPAGVLF